MRRVVIRAFTRSIAAELLQHRFLAEGAMHPYVGEDLNYARLMTVIGRAAVWVVRP